MGTAAQQVCSYCRNINKTAEKLTEVTIQANAEINIAFLQKNVPTQLATLR